jgi:hypothetical protein
MIPSTDPKSAFACTGLTIFQSPPSFANATALPPADTSKPSTFSRSNFRTDFSRRSNVVRFSEVSCVAGTRNTFFSSFRLANRSEPVGVFSPMSSFL